MPDTQTMTLAEFLELPGTLTMKERGQIIDQCIALIQSVYAHLPLKAALFAQAPDRRMRLLKEEMADISELSFHYALLDIFIDLRDLHTRYTLPAPYQTKAAYLPFTLQEYVENNRPRYVVAELLEEIDDPHFKVGLEVMLWNGVPIAKDIEALRRTTFGSNRASSHARAIQLMTLRHLAYSFAPVTDSVLVTYKNAHRTRFETRFQWKIAEAAVVKELFDHPKDDLLAVIRAVDPELHALNQVKQAVKSTSTTSANDSGASSAAESAPEPSQTTTIPDNFSVRTVNTEHGDYGYIRIATFEKTQTWPPLNTDGFIKAFLTEFQRLLTLIPQNGLILDLRGNAGGILPAGESLLQLFSPKPVDTALYQFRNTETTLALTKNAPDAYDFKGWIPSIEIGLRSGSDFSQALPFLPYSTSYNDIGQKYYGPVVLIIDALCYSTTDMFIAAFMDNGLGKVIGVDDNSGAGGANMWSSTAVMNILNQGKQTSAQGLPKGAALTLAVRRAVRVGQYAGQPIEDLGIVPDQVHRITKNDVLNGYVDLFNAAGAALAQQPAYGLNPQMSAVDGGIQITVGTSNLTRLDIYIDRRPFKTLDITDGEHIISDLSVPPGAQQLEILAFNQNTLAASAKIPLPTPETAPQ
ncbi:MAG TPA: S41 family peptidase [Herpetosiphonaceae bacterium]